MVASEIMQTMMMLIVVEIWKFVKSPVIRSPFCQDKSGTAWKRGKQKSDMVLVEWTNMDKVN